MSSTSEKIFCIGANKTGCCSLWQALYDLGYSIPPGERSGHFLKLWTDKTDFQLAVRFQAYVRHYEAFVDAPFSVMSIEDCEWAEKTYPEAKFILTLRREDEWYQSGLNYLKALFGKMPTIEDLKNCEHIYRGFAYDVTILNSGEEPFSEVKARAFYQARNESIQSFFEGAPNFLAIDISKPDSYAKLCEFLGKEPRYKRFPHLNKTADIKSPVYA